MEKFTLEFWVEWEPGKQKTEIATKLREIARLVESRNRDHGFIENDYLDIIGRWGWYETGEEP